MKRGVFCSPAFALPAAVPHVDGVHKLIQLLPLWAALSPVGPLPTAQPGLLPPLALPTQACNCQSWTDSLSRWTGRLVSHSRWVRKLHTTWATPAPELDEMRRVPRRVTRSTAAAALSLLPCPQPGQVTSWLRALFPLPCMRRVG